MLRFNIILLCFLFLSSCQNKQSLQTNELTNVKTSTIFLVRHAEKQLNKSNPSLTPEGHQRAERLAHILDSVKLDAIFSTDFKRTVQTAQPTAEAQQLSISSYDHTNLSDFAQEIRQNHQGENILIVGHSNTTPKLTGLLEGNDIYESFDESDYGNLVIVSIPKSGMAKTVFLRY